LEHKFKAVHFEDVQKTFINLCCVLLW